MCLASENVSFFCFLRPRASIAIAHISYGNSVRQAVRFSVCPSVTTRYRFKPRWDGEFTFSPYDCLESLRFRDNILCRWVRGIPTNKGVKKGHPVKRYFAAIGSSSVKMVADRHRHAAYHNKHWRLATSFLGMLTSMTLNDLEPPK